MTSPGPNFGYGPGDTPVSGPAVASASTVFAATQSITVANTAAETTVLGTGIGSLTLPANFFTVGRTLKIAAFGYHSASGNPSIRWRLYAGAVVLLDTGAVTSGNSSNAIWDIRGQIGCRTTGSLGTVRGEGFYTESAGGTNLFGMVNLANITLNTTVTQTLNLTVQWGTAAVGNTTTLTNLPLEVA